MGLLEANELDPGQVEVRALMAAADFNQARVLEVGTGSGRLTSRYARKSRFVAAVELDPARLAAAIGARRSPAPRQVFFVGADATTLPFRDQAFDVALLAWSL